MEEEYYFNLRFLPDDKRLVPILVTDIPGESQPQTVAYAVEARRRGTRVWLLGGHFHSNWQVENYRRMLLNALLWTAHADVPAGGVQSTLPADAAAVPASEKAASASDKAAPTAGKKENDARPIKTVIVTGNQHPAHLWRRRRRPWSKRCRAQARFQVTVQEDPEFLASPELTGFDLVVLNYCNWQRPGLSQPAR